MKTTTLALAVALLTGLLAPFAVSQETPEPVAIPPSLDHYLQARLAETAGQYREALELYGKAMNEDARNVEIRIAYASLLNNLGMSGQAMELLEGRNDLDWYGRKVLATAMVRQALNRPGLLPKAERLLRDVLGERADDPNVQIDLARVLMQEGKSAEAAELLTAVRRQRPGVARLQLLNAGALEQAGRFEEAIDLYRLCAPDSGVGSRCRARLVALLEKAGRSDEAARELLDLTPPEDTASRIEAASLLLDHGHAGKALRILDAVLAVAPDSTDALGLRASALVHLGRVQEAERTVRKLLKKNPDDIGLRLILVWAAMARNRFPEARRELGRAWRAAGEDGTSPAGIQVALTGARVELLAGHPGAAREWLGRIGSPEVAGRDLPVLLAETYRRSGDWREGVGALLRLQPRLSGEAREAAQALEAEMRLRSGDRKGLDTIQRLARSGSHEGAMAALQVCQTLEMWDALLSTAETVLERFPGDRSALFSKASALERLGRREEAATVFRKILEQTPDDDDAANYLGYMWADAGEHLDEALELIQRAVAADPDSGAYLDSLGWVYFRKGNLAQAEHWLRMAVRKGAIDGTVLAHLGEVLLRRGKKDEALELLRRALDLGCEHSDHVRELVEAASGSGKKQ